MANYIKINLRILAFLLISLMLSACSTRLPDSETRSSSEASTFLVGSYTQGTSQGIYQITLGPKANSLVNDGLVGIETNPSYLAVNKANRTLFAATKDNSGGISIFTPSLNSNLYEKAFELTGLGKGTCHIALSPDGSKVAIANYGSGDIFQFDVTPDTHQLTNKQHFKNTGSGITKRQTAPHMHYVQWDNSGKYLYAVDLGTDQILVFSAATNGFTPIVAATLDAGDGPRHLSFHPTRPDVYVINELSNSVTAFSINQQTGVLTQTDKLPLLTDNPTATNFGSAIKTSADGKHLYAAVRGVNEIKVIDISKGQLKLKQTIKTAGHWPRDIELSYNQRYLLIANQYSGTITALRRNTDTGLLTATEMELAIDTPSYLGAVPN